MRIRVSGDLRELGLRLEFTPHRIILGSESGKKSAKLRGLVEFLFGVEVEFCFLVQEEYEM